MRPAGVGPLLRHRRVVLVPVRAALPAVQLDRGEPLLHQGEQREPEHRGRRREVRPVAGRGPVPGPLREVPDLRERPADAQRRLRRQDAGMLGVHLSAMFHAFKSSVMVAADVIC